MSCSAGKPSHPRDSPTLPPSLVPLPTSLPPSLVPLPTSLPHYVHTPAQPHSRASSSGDVSPASTPTSASEPINSPFTCHRAAALRASSVDSSEEGRANSKTRRRKRNRKNKKMNKQDLSMMQQGKLGNGNCEVQPSEIRVETSECESMSSGVKVTGSESEGEMRSVEVDLNIDTNTGSMEDVANIPEHLDTEREIREMTGAEANGREEASDNKLAESIKVEDESNSMKEEQLEVRKLNGERHGETDESEERGVDERLGKESESGERGVNVCERDGNTDVEEVEGSEREAYYGEVRGGERKMDGDRDEREERHEVADESEECEKIRTADSGREVDDCAAAGGDEEERGEIETTEVIRREENEEPNADNDERGNTDDNQAFGERGELEMVVDGGWETFDANEVTEAKIVTDKEAAAVTFDNRETSLEATEMKANDELEGEHKDMANYTTVRFNEREENNEDMEVKDGEENNEDTDEEDVVLDHVSNEVNYRDAESTGERAVIDPEEEITDRRTTEANEPVEVTDREPTADRTSEAIEELHDRGNSEVNQTDEVREIIDEREVEGSNTNDAVEENEGVVVCTPATNQPNEMVTSVLINDNLEDLNQCGETTECLEATKEEEGAIEIVELVGEEKEDIEEPHIAGLERDIMSMSIYEKQDEEMTEEEEKLKSDTEEDMAQEQKFQEEVAKEEKLAELNNEPMEDTFPNQEGKEYEAALITSTKKIDEESKHTTSDIVRTTEENQFPGEKLELVGVLEGEDQEDIPIYEVKNENEEENMETELEEERDLGEDQEEVRPREAYEGEMEKEVVEERKDLELEVERDLVKHENEQEEIEIGVEERDFRDNLEDKEKVVEEVKERQDYEGDLEREVVVEDERKDLEVTRDLAMVEANKEYDEAERKVVEDSEMLISNEVEEREMVGEVEKEINVEEREKDIVIEDMVELERAGEISDYKDEQVGSDTVARNDSSEVVVDSEEMMVQKDVMAVSETCAKDPEEEAKGSEGVICEPVTGIDTAEPTEEQKVETKEDDKETKTDAADTTPAATSTVYAALAELDSIPDGVCESGEVEEEEEEEEEWSYYRMEPASQPQGEDVLVGGAATGAETEQMADPSGPPTDPKQRPLSADLSPLAEPFVPSAELHSPTRAPEDKEPLKDDLFFKEDSGVAGEAQVLDLDFQLGNKDKDHFQTDMNIPMEADQAPVMESTSDILQASMETGPISDLSTDKMVMDEPSSPQMPGSPRSVEGFVTSVELNAPDDSLGTNFNFTQGQEINGSSIEKPSGPFSVYVSSSPEPVSLDPSLQAPTDLASMTVSNGHAEEEGTLPQSGDLSPVEIVHAQSTVEVLTPPSPGVEPVLEPFVKPDMTSDLLQDDSDITFIPEPAVQPVAELPEPVYIEGTTPVSEAEPDVSISTPVSDGKPEELVNDIATYEEVLHVMPEREMIETKIVLADMDPDYFTRTEDFVKEDYNPFILEQAMQPSETQIQELIKVPNSDIPEPPAVFTTPEIIEIAPEIQPEIPLEISPEVPEVPEVKVAVPEVKTETVKSSVKAEPAKSPAKSPTKTARTPLRSSSDKTGKITPARDTPGKTPPSRTPSTRTPTTKPAEKKTTGLKADSKPSPTKITAAKPAARTGPAKPTTARTTTTKPLTKPTTTRPATGKAPTPTQPTAAKSIEKKAPKPATPTVPRAALSRPSSATNKPTAARPSPTTRTTTTTRPTPASRTTTTTATKRPTTAPPAKPDTSKLNGTAGKPSTTTRTTTPRTTTATTTAARKPLSTTRPAPKSAAEKETKNTTNRILSSTNKPAAAKSTTTRTISRTTATGATRSSTTESKTTTRMNGTAGSTTTTKSRITTKSTAAKATGVAAKKTGVLKGKTDSKADPVTKKADPSPTIEASAPVVNGENKIAHEETSVEVIEKSVGENLVVENKTVEIMEAMETEASQQQVITTTTMETTEVIVNGDH